MNSGYCPAQCAPPALIRWQCDHLLAVRDQVSAEDRPNTGGGTGALELHRSVHAISVGAGQGAEAVPGSRFGLAPYFRLSYATSEQNLREAVMRIAKACRELS